MIYVGYSTQWLLAIIAIMVRRANGRPGNILCQEEGLEWAL